VSTKKSPVKHTQAEISRKNNWNWQKLKKMLYPFLVLFVLLMLSYIVFLPVPETEIELIINVTYLEFDTPNLPQNQILLSNLKAKSIGAKRLNQVGVLGTQPQRSQKNEFIDMLLSAKDAESTLSLGELRLNSDSTVQIGVNPSEKNKYDLTITGTELTTNVQAKGIIEVIAKELTPFPDTQLEIPYGGQITLFPSANREDREELSLAIMTPINRKDYIASQVTTSQIRLFEIVNSFDTQKSLVQRVSSIESGTLFLEELDSKELKLRPGEPLQFDSAEGIIRRIDLNNEYLTLQFRGIVKGLRTGLPNSSRSLMPTYIERLQANNSLMTLLGAVIALLTLVFTAFDWWREIREP
jgi:hypothetical protein